MRLALQTIWLLDWGTHLRKKCTKKIYIHLLCCVWVFGFFVDLIKYQTWVMFCVTVAMSEEQLCIVFVLPCQGVIDWSHVGRRREVAIVQDSLW